MSKDRLYFSKKDKYDNPVFLVTKKKNPNEYDNLLKKYTKLVEKKYDTFLPIYINTNYDFAKITFKKHEKIPMLKVGGLYEVEYILTTHEYNDKNYVNCNIKNVKLIAEPSKNKEIELILDD